MLFKLKNRSFYCGIALLLYFAMLFPRLVSASQSDNYIWMDPQITTPDTSLVKKDTTDTLRAASDTLNLPVSTSALPSSVKYSAKDSIVYDIRNKKVYLYDSAKLHYEDIDLKSARVTIDWTKNQIDAEGKTDSAGKTYGTPVFKEKDQEYRTKKIAYNFKTKKGKISELITQEGEGYVHVGEGKYIKTDSVNTVYAKDAKYTTCNLPDPHYYIKTNKLKIIPKDKIITGMALMHIEDVPVPLVLPFGFFPADSRRSSGLIFPQYGEDVNRGGFFLRNGGYYFGLSDYFDLALTGDIYANGGYGGKAVTNYAKRYRSRGTVQIGYSNLTTGLEDVNQAEEEQYNVRWQHVQDPKAVPNFSFSADVNAGSSKYQRFNNYDMNQRLNANMNSNINLTKRFGNSPFSLSTSLSHTQNTQTGAVNMTLPQMAFTMQRIFPFKGKRDVGGTRWYDNIGMNYNLDFRNYLQTGDSVFGFNRETFKNFQNGFTHTLPISTSLKAFNYFTISPAINYRGYFYFKSVEKYLDTATNRIERREINGFSQAHEYNVTANMNTRIFGMFNINRGKFVALRHVLEPTIGAEYKPDFTESQYGYFRKVADSAGELQTYSKFENFFMGGPDPNKFAGLNFAVNNNLELKVRGGKDTTAATKKIKLIESFSISSRYNFAVDSFQLAPILLNGFTTVYEKININASATFDPYQINNRGRRVNRLEIDDNNRLARLTNANVGFSTTLNPQARDKEKELRTADPRIGYYYPGTYVDFAVPWNLSLGYVLSYNKYFDNNQERMRDTITQTVQLSGALALTPKWKINFFGGYDINRNEVTSPKIDIIRDLHCWEMRFEWVPYGPLQMYFFSIYIKASSLRDLKYDVRKSYQEYR